MLSRDGGGRLKLPDLAATSPLTLDGGGPRSLPGPRALSRSRGQVVCSRVPPLPWKIFSSTAVVVDVGHVVDHGVAEPRSPKGGVQGQALRLSAGR